jgi:predicted Fe-Mo cluster-binding NifX family protein
MRLVFPTDENQGYLSKRGAHFGKAKFYTIITLENNKIVDVEGVPNQGHSGACSNAVQNIMDLKPDVLIVTGIGPRPAQGFLDVGLDVYFDQVSENVQDSVNLFIENRLPKVENQGTCKTK